MLTALLGLLTIVAVGASLGMVLVAWLATHPTVRDTDDAELTALGHVLTGDSPYRW